MAIYLSHEDVKGLIRMGDILQGAEQAFKDCGLGSATNLPRQRLGVPKGVYRVMSGAVPREACTSSPFPRGFRRVTT